MKRRRVIRKARKPVAFGILLSASALMLHTRGGAEAAPQPDPAEVQRFLIQLEEEQAVQQTAAANSNRGKRLHNLVESAATRAPSAAMISQLEDVVSEKLG